MANIFTNQNGDLSWGGLVNALQNIEDATSMSLFQYTRRSVVNSRVYIDNTIAQEEIMTPLMLNMMNLYVGLIMTAVNMNRYIQGTRKVRDAMSVVATEAWEEPNLKDSIHSFFLSDLPISGAFTDIGDDNKNSAGVSRSGTVASEPRQDINLPSGRIIQVEFGSSEDRSKHFTINLLVQLLPTIIPADVAQQFVAINFKPSFSQRWMQMSAGEISFFSDLMLGNDLRKQRYQALKHDKSGALQQMIDRQENNLSNYWLKLAQVNPERQNLANTILLFDKVNFEKACSNSGLNFKTYSARQKFFNATMSMIVGVIDPMYNKVRLYFHGITDPAEYTFDQVKRNAKTESTDILAMMKSYAQGMAPRF